MKNLLPGLHPSFEGLSAYADLNDVDRVSSRLTRHVARCAECQAVVRDVQELGARARAEEAPAVDPALWIRIEEGAREGHVATPAITAESYSAVWEPAPALKPTSSWPVPLDRKRSRWWALGIVAAAAAVMAIVAWPGREPLEAAGTSRLTFSPARPVPGGLVKVRYTAAPWLRGQPRLVLVAAATSDTTARYFRPSMGDSVATLRPVSGGAYEAQFRLRPNAGALWLGVSDSLGNEADVDGWRPWMAIAGEKDGRPSLTALLAAARVAASFNGAEQFRSRQALDAADSLRRYFPGMPAGWAYARPKEGKGTLFERLVSFFDSSERKYLAFYNELWPRKNLDAERMHEMVAFGAVIDEPAEANRWARRLALEHPEDPRALQDLADALHQLELTQPPALRDSIREWLPVLDRVYRQSRGAVDRYAFMQLITRYADSSTVALWNARMDSTGRDDYWMRDYETNAAHRKRAEAIWLQDAQRSCDRGAGRFPFQVFVGGWGAGCQRGRSIAFGYLAHAKLLDGDARMALSYADSSRQTYSRGCTRYWGSELVEIPASLLVGDTARAERATIRRIAGWPNGQPDSVTRWLGERARSPRIQAAIDSVRREYDACAASEKARREARMQR